jgi:hypothetical protein
LSFWNSLPLSTDAASKRSAAAGTGAVLVLLTISLGSVLALGPYDLDRILLLQVVLMVGCTALFIMTQLPQAGIPLMIAGGLLVKFEVGTGTQSGLNFALLLAPVLIAVFIARMVFHRDQWPLRSQTLVPIRSFMIVMCIAFVVGQYPWFPSEPAPMHAQVGQLAIFLFSGGIFILAAHQLQNPRILRTSVWVFLGAGTVLLLPRILPWFGIWRILPQTIAGQSMYWTWLVALSTGQVVINRDLPKWHRVALALVALTALAIGIAERDWLSGWLPPLLAAYIIVTLRFPTATLVLTPLMGVIAFVGANLFFGFVMGSDNQYSYMTRTAALKSMIPLFKADPLLGVGMANYYYYTALTPIMGWYVKFNSHNNYLDLIAQSGILGLGCFLWFALMVGLTAWRMLHVVSTGFERAYIISVLAALVATMAAAGMGDWVLPFVYNTGFSGFRTSILPWVFMGGLVALEQRLLRNV